MSKTTKISLLLALVLVQISILTLGLYDDIYSEGPFLAASKRWNQAFYKGDEAAMSEALKDERKAICTSLFAPDDMCPVKE